jgi:dynactin 1
MIHSDLYRLRDLSQETEQEQRRKIAELEKDLAASEEMQCKGSFTEF